MFSSFTKSAAVLSTLLLVPSALATIYVTEPVSTSTLTAGTPFQIVWAEDLNTPLLATLGTCDIGLWVGSVTQQVELQTISASYDVAASGSISMTIDPSVGADSNQYFIRFVSNSYIDPTSNAKYSSYSSKFTVSGMTGTFNSTIQALIDSGSTTTVGLGAATSTATLTTSKTSTISASSTAIASVTKANAAVSGSASAKAASTSAKASSASSIKITSAFVGSAVVAVVMALAL